MRNSRQKTDLTLYTRIREREREREKEREREMTN